MRADPAAAMLLFDQTDHFQIIDRTSRVVVGAPHHGVRPNVDADVGTGPITAALAQRLNARAVIVSDLRRKVDVNKNPLRCGSNVRPHALRYQNEMFRSQPCLVLEVHGHVSGQYAIEIATGYELDASLVGDARFLQKLAAVKQSLPLLLASHIGQNPTVGVYPIDRDVKKTATDTFTFQKIRRARRLADAEWYGLHIELNAELRTTKQAQSALFVEALADAFATAIESAFDPLPALDATIPAYADQADGSTPLVTSQSLSVTLAPEQYASANVVVVNPIDLQALSAREGDVVVLRHDHEELRSALTPSLIVQPGHAALPARVRRQIGLRERDHVIVGCPAPIAPKLPSAANRSLFILNEMRDIPDRCVWLSPDEIRRLSLRIDSPIVVQGQPRTAPANSVVLKSDASLLPRRAGMSRAVMDQRALTLGEVIAIQRLNE